AVDVDLRAVGAADVATPARSAAVMLSSGVYGRLAAAVDRSELRALSAAVILLSPFEQANARNAAGRISNFLNILKPPGRPPRIATVLYRRAFNVPNQTFGYANVAADNAGSGTKSSSKEAGSMRRKVL